MGRPIKRHLRHVLMRIGNTESWQKEIWEDGILKMKQKDACCTVAVSWSLA